MERFGESFFYWSGVVFIGLVLIAFGLAIWMAVKGYLSGSSEVVEEAENEEKLLPIYSHEEIENECKKAAENLAKLAYESGHSSSEYGLSGAKWSVSEEDVLEDKNSEDVKPTYDKLR